MKTTMTTDSSWRNMIAKKYGKDTIRSAETLSVREYRGSGSLALDVALGGGWGKRTIVQLTGLQSAGKTLLFDLAAICAQRDGKRSLIFDFEGSYDKRRFISMGGDPSMLDVINHENTNRPMLFAEDAFDMAKIILPATDEYACIAFDSTGAMVSIHEYEKKMDKGQEANTPFLTASAITSGLKILVGMIARSPSAPTVFFVSQGRDNIGFNGFGYGPPPDKQTGGRALEFFASTRVKVSRGDIFKGDIIGGEKDVEVGHVTKVKVNKNKCNNMQGRVAQFDLYHDGEFHGIDRVGELAKLAVFTRVIKQSGSWYDLPNKERCQGFDALKKRLGEPGPNALFHEIERATRTALAAVMDERREPNEEE